MLYFIFICIIIKVNHILNVIKIIESEKCCFYCIIMFLSIYHKNFIGEQLKLVKQKEVYLYDIHRQFCKVF